MPLTSIESAQQFRAMMIAMANPGSHHVVKAEAAPGLSVAATATLMTLVDQDTTVFATNSVDTAEFRQWLAFHTGARFVAKQSADFAIGRFEDLLPLTDFKTGTEEYPDKSCTLIVDGWDQVEPITARGPGIASQVRLNLPSPEQIQAVNRFYPLGLDLFFTEGDQLFAVPRSTRLEV